MPAEVLSSARSAMAARVSPSIGETTGPGLVRPAPGAAARIPSLDLLRGFALLGMIVVHFHARSTEPGGIDDIVRTAVWRLIEGKSFGTFALLFGAGFALQLRSAERQHRPFAGSYLRRLAVLAVFGAAAHALFGFNVLLGYAVWGIPLLALRRWPTPALIGAALLCAASVAVYEGAAAHRLARQGGAEAVAAAAESRRATASAVGDALRQASSQGDYGDLLRARLAHMAWFYTRPFSLLPGVTLALFIAGLLLVRHGVFEHPLAHRRLLATMAAGGAVSWLLANWLLAGRLTGVAGALVREQWLTFTYVAACLAAVAHRPGLLVPLGPVADAGRLALTNYLLQIAVIDVLFAGYGIGLGSVRPTVGLAAACALFLVQARLSTLWLSRFRIGPAEWIWRALAGHAGPLRGAAVAR